MPQALGTTKTHSALVHAAGGSVRQPGYSSGRVRSSRCGWSSTQPRSVRVFPLSAFRFPLFPRGSWRVVLVLVRVRLPPVEMGLSAQTILNAVVDGGNDCSHFAKCEIPEGLTQR